MNAPKWLDETVRAFGRQLQLERLALSDRGVAGVRFEDGGELTLEYAHERLALMVTRPAVGVRGFVRRVLMAAHPEARRRFSVRSGVMEKSGRAFYVSSLHERDVTVDVLSQLFGELWAVAKAVEGGAA